MPQKMKHNLGLKNMMFSGPIPGQSLTHAPKSMPWEKPPQFNTLSEAMHFLMDQMTQSMYLRRLLMLMDSGMPLEAIARTILFTGFTLGKWNPNLAMLMYKPLMVSLLAIAHRTKMHDTPITMPNSMEKYLKTNAMGLSMANRVNNRQGPTQEITPPEPPSSSPSPNAGFMNKGVI